MKRIVKSGCWTAVGVALILAAAGRAQAPEMAGPTKEHGQLAQFAGEWDVTAETVPAAGQEAIRATGTESSKMIGGFWFIGQTEASMMGMPVTSILTLGYDPATQKYVGTFVCSVDSILWHYEGTMDEAGTTLTLETEGPSMLDLSKKAKYREVLELKDKDHKVFTSFMQDDKGEWVKIVTMDYRRKK